MIKLLALASTAGSLAIAAPAFADASSTGTSIAPAASSIYGYNPISRCYYALPLGQYTNYRPGPYWQRC